MGVQKVIALQTVEWPPFKQRKNGSSLKKSKTVGEGGAGNKERDRARETRTEVDRNYEDYKRKRSGDYEDYKRKRYGTGYEDYKRKRYGADYEDYKRKRSGDYADYNDYKKNV